MKNIYEIIQRIENNNLHQIVYIMISKYSKMALC